MVVIDRAFVRAGKDHQRAIFLGHIVNANTYGEDVVVGMGVEGIVLMPFHRRAISGLLHIEFGGVQAEIDFSDDAINQAVVDFSAGRLAAIEQWQNEINGLPTMKRLRTPMCARNWPES